MKLRQEADGRYTIEADTNDQELELARLTESGTRIGVIAVSGCEANRSPAVGQSLHAALEVE